MLLLEVLIAFAIVALAILPLISSHVAIFKMQRNFIHSLELDHFVNRKYAEIIEKLYLSEISWSVIEGGERVPLSHKGYYQFKEILHKPKEKGPYTLYLMELNFVFPRKNKENITYSYQIFLIRDVPGTPPIEEEALQ